GRLLAAQPPAAIVAARPVAPARNSLRVPMVTSGFRSSGADDTLPRSRCACRSQRLTGGNVMETAGLSRRQVLGIAVGAGGLAFAGRFEAAFAQGLKPTPGEILGPFYPVIKTVEQGADLTVVPGKLGRAAGQIIHVMGRVLNVQGDPIKGARVELWQANTHGRYTHP